MKIISAQVDLQSQHQASKSELLHSRIQSWQTLSNGQRVENMQESLQAETVKTQLSQSDKVSISAAATQAADQAEAAMQNMQPQDRPEMKPPRVEPPKIKPETLPSPPPKVVNPPKAGPQIEAIHDSKMELMRLVIERFSGYHIKVIDAAELQKTRETGQTQEQQPAQNQQATQSEQAVQQGWGVDVQITHVVAESEQTSFHAQALIKTADGQEIAVDVQLNMSREYVEFNQVHLQAGDAVKKDPLVVNFAGTAAELDQRSFNFDIDMDGQSDQIAFVKQGSGFLALDRNGDGQINDGSELFGPTRGDGFAELAAYDEDGNQFIDEGDSVYDRLRIWSQDAQGNKQLVALGQRGIGAIYLGKVDTPFSMRDGQNQELGQVRTSGLYLKEDGGAGTVQQIDLVV